MKLNTFECFLRLRFGLLIFLDKGDARAGDFDVQDLGWGHPDEESHLRRQLQGEPGGVAVKPVATDSAGSNEIGQNGSTKNVSNLFGFEHMQSSISRCERIKSLFLPIGKLQMYAE
jgi:hypothetical protein